MASTHESDPRRDAEDLDEPALEGPLLSGLAEVFPGFELLDSDLEFERPHRVQYVGLDGAGRLTLVLRVRGEGHSAILRALDARDFARRHLTPLLRHLAARRARAELAPRVALIATEYDERLRRRLENLVDCGIEAFELRRLRSHSGELVFLAPLTTLPRAAPEPAPTLDEFLAGLDEERRSAVEALLARLEHLDHALEVETRGEGLAWRLGDEVLAELSTDDEGEVHLAAAGRDARCWRTPRDVEGFVEDAVAVYLERAGHGKEPPPERRPVPDLAEVAALAAAPRKERAHADGGLGGDALELYGD